MNHKINAVLVALLFALLGSGCQTLKEVANLRNVRFAIDRVSEAQLAGVDVQHIRSYQDLSIGDVARLTAAVANNELPLDFTLHLNAENPSENRANARLVQMNWTLLLDEEETISGVFDQTIIMPPGEPTDVAIPMRIDLVDFFDRGARDLIELALAVAGQGGAPKRIKLEAIPTIETPIGPIRYPNPIMIVSTEVGSRGGEPEYVTRCKLRCQEALGIVHVRLG